MNGGDLVLDPYMPGDRRVQEPMAPPDASLRPGEAAQTPQATATALKLAELMPANEKWANPYYAAYTNSGDIAAAIPATLTDQQRVRLLDPNTGETLAEGFGKAGAQQIATLANAVSSDLGRKAAWKIDVETSPDQFQTIGYDRADPKHQGWQTFLKIVAPLLGAAIPGIAPALGAALGGAGASLATGGDLKDALLSAATAGVGNAAGGALSAALRGVPVAWSGVNALGGLANAGQHALSNLTFGGSLGQALGQAVTEGGITTVAPITATAGQVGLQSALGGGLGSLAGTALGNAMTSTPGVTQPSTVEELTVTGNPSTGLPVPGIPLPTENTAVPTQEGPTTGDKVKDTLLDVTGQTIGGVAGDLGVYGLANLLGLTPGGGVSPEVQAPPGAPVDSAIDIGQVANTPGSQTIGSSGTGGSTGYGDFGGGGATQGALGAVLNAGAGGSGAPIASAPKFNGQGALAPDIYPWRRKEGVASQ